MLKVLDNGNCQHILGFPNDHQSPALSPPSRLVPALPHLHRIRMDLMRRQRIPDPMAARTPPALAWLVGMEAPVEAIGENGVLRMEQRSEQFDQRILRMRPHMATPTLVTPNTLHVGQAPPPWWTTMVQIEPRVS